MKFNITLTDEDYIRLNQKLLLTSPEGKRTLQLMRLCPIVVSCLAVFCIAVAGARTGVLIAVIIALAALCIVMEIFTKKWLMRLMEYAVKKTMNSEKLPYTPESVIEFGENEILKDSDEMTVTAPYKSFHKIDMDEDYIYLLKDSAAGFILPVRCLQGRETEVWEYVREKTGL